MANEVRDLWTEVGNKCLQRASELLDDKTAPAAATAETVRCLVETAISMDMLNLLWDVCSKLKAHPTSLTAEEIATIIAEDLKSRLSSAHIHESY